MFCGVPVGGMEEKTNICRKGRFTLSLSLCNDHDKYECWRKINVRRRHMHLMLKKSLSMLSMLEKLFKGCSSMLKKNITPVILPRTVRPIVVD